MHDVKRIKNKDFSHLWVFGVLVFGVRAFEFLVIGVLVFGVQDIVVLVFGVLVWIPGSLSLDYAHCKECLEMIK